jgi:hypothetical protein
MGMGKLIDVLETESVLCYNDQILYYTDRGWQVGLVLVNRKYLCLSPNDLFWSLCRSKASFLVLSVLYHPIHSRRFLSTQRETVVCSKYVSYSS